jgi:hypothetical protein
MADLLRLRLERVAVRGTVNRHLLAIEASHFIESALSNLSAVYLSDEQLTAVRHHAEATHARTLSPAH